MYKSKIVNMLILLGVLLGSGSSATAANNLEHQHNHQFQPIEQSLETKVGVTLGGIALIGLELWWFILSKNKSRQKTEN